VPSGWPKRASPSRSCTRTGYVPCHISLSPYPADLLPPPLNRLSQWQRSENLIKNASPSADAMLLNGRAPKQGEIMRFPDLAKTFRAVADEGRKGFYEGRVAEAIVELIQVRSSTMLVPARG
jgi:hypothetical protein